MFFLIIFLYAIVASSFTIAKAVLAYASPIFFVAFRMMIAGSLLLGYFFWRKSRRIAIKKQDHILFFFITLFHIYFAFVLDLVALQKMSSFKGAFLYNLSPFLAAFFSYFYFHERMTAKKWLGLAIGFLGFLPELMMRMPQEKVIKGLFFLSTSELLMLGSVASSVLGWILVRRLVHKGYSPIFINGYSMFCGGFLALGTSIFFESWHPVPVFAWTPFLLLTFLIIVLSNIISYNVQGHLLKQYTATFLSFAGFLSPLFAALFGWIFLGEHPQWHFFFSLIVVVIGLTLFYAEELRQGYIKR